MCADFAFPTAVNMGSLAKRREVERGNNPSKCPVHLASGQGLGQPQGPGGNWQDSLLRGSGGPRRKRTRLYVTLPLQPCPLCILCRVSGVHLLSFPNLAPRLPFHYCLLGSVRSQQGSGLLPSFSLHLSSSIRADHSLRGSERWAPMVHGARALELVLQQQNELVGAGPLDLRDIV